MKRDVAPTYICKSAGHPRGAVWAGVSQARLSFGKYKKVLLTGAVLMLFSEAALAQSDVYWDGGNSVPHGGTDGGGGTWDDVSTNWSTEFGTVYLDTHAFSGKPNRIFSGSAGTVNVTAADAQASQLHFVTSGYKLTGASVNVLGPVILDADTDTTFSNTVTATGLNATSTSNIVNKGSLIFNLSSDVTYGGVISSTGSITQQGNGVLTLTGNNTYTGSSTIASDRTLKVGTGGTSGAIGGEITNNGTLIFDRSDTVELTQLVGGAGVIRHQGGGDLVFYRASDTDATYDGDIEVKGGRFSLGTMNMGGNGRLILDGGTFYPLRTAAYNADIVLTENGGTIGDYPEVIYIHPSVFNGDISGPGKLTTLGRAIVRLRGEKTWSGGLEMKSQVSILSSPAHLNSPLGSGLVTINTSSNLYIATDVVLPNDLLIASTGGVSAAANYDITLAGDIDMGGREDVLRLGRTGSGSFKDLVTFSGALSNGGFVVDSNDYNSKDTRLEFTGNTANTYTGLTRIETIARNDLRFKLNKSANVTAVPGNLTVDPGTDVIVVNDEQIADSAAVQLEAGAVLTLGDGAGATETIAEINGTGDVSLTSLSELRVSSGSFGGVISGDGTLVKQGADTLELSGSNTFTGSTTVAAGQLRISGSVASNITVNSGATLSGTGIAAAVQMDAGAKLTPGASAGTISTGNLSLNATSVLDVELDAPGTVGGGVNDLIAVTGDLVLDGVLNITDLGALAAGTYTLFTYTGTLTDNGIVLGSAPAGFVYSVDVDQADSVRLLIASEAAILELSAAELDFGTRSIDGPAATQILRIRSSGNVAVNVGTVALSGTHVSDFTITADTCSDVSLAVDAQCSVTISQESDTSGVRTAQLDIPSDVDDNPQTVALRARAVGELVLDGLEGLSQIFRLDSDPILLDPNGDTTLSISDALNLDEGTLLVEIISGARAGEDVLSFATSGDVSLTATTAGSNVLVGGVEIGTLDNAIAAGEVLSVTFNAEATVARVQTLMQAVTYLNQNNTNPINGVREIRVTLRYLEQEVVATLSVDIQQVELMLSVSELNFGTRSVNASAATQVLTIGKNGSLTVNVGHITVGGDHAADFTITDDTCSDTALVAAAECSVTVRQEGDTSGLRTAKLNVPSDADYNPHALNLIVRLVAAPVFEGLDGGSQIFRVGADPLLLDPAGDASISVSGALHLKDGTLQVELISGAEAGEDILSFSTAGGVSLSATTSGSNVLVDDIVIGTLDNAIETGAVLSLTLNEEATVARVQTLVQAMTYQNLNINDPVNGVREIRITLSYLDQDVAVTVSVDVQPIPSPTPIPVSPPAGYVTAEVINGTLTGTITIGAGGVVNGGSIDGEVTSTGEITGDVILGAQATISGGIITGNLVGDPEAPATISGATITGDASLSHVIVGFGVTLQPGVTLGEGVIFESPGLIDEIRSLIALFANGAIIEQLDNGQISITADAYRALLLPVQIVQAADGQTSGIYFGENADVLLITEGGLGIRVYGLPINDDSLKGDLSDRSLEERSSPTGRLIVTDVEVSSAELARADRVLALQAEEVYFSARSDLIATPDDQSKNLGLAEYPVAGLGMVQHLSLLFVANDNTRMRQDIMPAPANWLALKEGLLNMDGVTVVRIDTRGVIHVSIDGISLQGVMDYSVVRGAGGEVGILSLDRVGDLTGNGMDDYRVTYANGDRQILFVFHPLAYAAD